MPLPALSQFLVYPPGFLLTTPVLEVARTLSSSYGAPCSHLIIIDAHQRPTGALPIRRLWSYSQKFNQQDCLNQLERWIEPIVQVSAQQTISAIWPLPPADTAPPVVVVDDHMRYVGIINPLSVLTWLSGEILADTEGLSLRGNVTSLGTPIMGDHRNWLLEVSHALKNPMTSLLGLSTLLLDRRVGPLTDRQTRYATLMQQVVRKLIGMVNQLLDWMRLDANQLNFDIDTIPLQPFAHQVISSYLAQLPASQDPEPWIERFTLDLPPESLAIRGDSLRLQQSVHWILDYLRLHQAEPQGLEVSLWGPWLGLTLWASGPSIEQLQSMTAWEQPLPSGDMTTKPNSLDSLGLLLARRFCKMQGGDLTYQVSNRGNRITLLLPQASLDESREANPELSSATVLALMACRDTDVIDQVCLQLQGSNYRLAIARSASEAEAMVQRLSPTFLISYARSFPEAETRLGSASTRGSASGRAPLVIQLTTEPETINNGTERGCHRVTIQTLKPILDRLRETSFPASSQPTLPGFTILLLPPPQPEPGKPIRVGLTADLRSWLQHYQCRLLQVDDLQQAKVIRRIWQPDATLLDTQQKIPPNYWQALAQLPELCTLPLITLTDDENKAMVESYGLQIYPCLMTNHQPAQIVAISLIQTIATALDS